jgi:hypothetical protein
MDLFFEFLTTLKNTIVDVLPILVIILGFQLFVIRQLLPQIKTPMIFVVIYGMVIS